MSILPYDPTSLLARLNDVRDNRTANKFYAKCPAHDDSQPSLDIYFNDETGRVLLHCFAGCRLVDILKAMQIGLSHLRYTPILHDPAVGAGRNRGNDAAKHANDRFLVLEARENANHGRSITPEQFEATLRVVGRFYTAKFGEPIPPDGIPCADGGVVDEET